MRKKVWIGAALIVAAVAWYAFRPELLFVNKSVSESFPAPSVAANTTDRAASPKRLAEGQCKGYAHETQGEAKIYDINGKRVLRLTNFKTSNGPDVHVYLVAARDAKDDATVKNAGFVDLGSMKGNMGDQNYDVPDTADLTKYRAVTIWCKRFSINFGTAPLAPTTINGEALKGE